MRVVMFLVVAALVLAILLPLLRRPGRPSARRPPVGGDELVKDPVCQTYVARSRAVTRRGRDGAPYFCSAECARRYAG